MQLARRISLLVAFFLLASAATRHPGVCVGVVAARPPTITQSSNASEVYDSLAYSEDVAQGEL